MSENS
jgi:solute carrier family 25 (mitochondrial carnitine/acylcarnitine transporter), member 20/29